MKNIVRLFSEAILPFSLIYFYLYPLDIIKYNPSILKYIYIVPQLEIISLVFAYFLLVAIKLSETKIKTKKNNGFSNVLLITVSSVIVLNVGARVYVSFNLIWIMPYVINFFSRIYHWKEMGLSKKQFLIFLQVHIAYAVSIFVILYIALDMYITLPRFGFTPDAMVEINKLALELKKIKPVDLNDLIITLFCLILYFLTVSIFERFFIKKYMQGYKGVNKNE